MCGSGDRGSFVSGYFPFYTPIKIAIVLVFFGIACLALGIIISIMGTNECSASYDSSMADSGGQITVSFAECLKKSMETPVYVYYEIDGFYQNQRIYSQSFPILANDYSKVNFAGDSCRGRVYHDDGRILFPCGLLATSVFNDTFNVFLGSDQLNLSDYGVAWPQDIDAVRDPDPADLPSNVYYWLDKSIFPGGVANPRFLSWVRPSPTSKFRKLYGTITADNIPSGTTGLIMTDDLKVVIDQRWLTDQPGIRRKVIIGESTWIGPVGSGVPLTLILIGAAEIVVAIALVSIWLAGRSRSSNTNSNAAIHSSVGYNDRTFSGVLNNIQQHGGAAGGNAKLSLRGGGGIYSVAGNNINAAHGFAHSSSMAMRHVQSGDKRLNSLNNNSIVHKKNKNQVPTNNNYNSSNHTKPSTTTNNENLMSYPLDMVSVTTHNPFPTLPSAIISNNNINTTATNTSNFNTPSLNIDQKYQKKLNGDGDFFLKDAKRDNSST